MISTQEKDYLEQDPEIRNQKYVCMSFISPEDVLKKKDVFYFENFIKEYSSKNNELLDGLEIMFPDKKDEIRSIKEQYNMFFDSSTIHENYCSYLKENSTKLDKLFTEENDFQTNIRGIKVRGVYDNINEAQARCDSLRKFDNNKFCIYIGEVGCWCPWSPNPDNVSNPVYAETQLNTLMAEYNKNMDKKDEYYAERKNELRDRIKENEDKKKKLLNTEETTEAYNTEETDLINTLEKDDTWSQHEKL